MAHDYIETSAFDSHCNSSFGTYLTAKDGMHFASWHVLKMQIAVLCCIYIKGEVGLSQRHGFRHQALAAVE